MQGISICTRFFFKSESVGFHRRSVIMCGSLGVIYDLLNVSVSWSLRRGVSLSSSPLPHPPSVNIICDFCGYVLHEVFLTD